VSVVIVTDGSSAQYPGDEEQLRRKQEQARCATRSLGCDALVQWDYPDMRLDAVPHVELNASLQRLIDEHRFDTVFVHHPSDVNLDHRRIYESTLVATRPTPDGPVRQLLAYEVNSSTEWGAGMPWAAFRPDVYVDISATIERKLAALEHYRGELRPYPHPRSLEAVRDRARVRGAEVGMASAEAFELVFMRGALARASRR
jgi:LmbE family N-acetylglucosaminyl deacetylase